MLGEWVARHHGKVLHAVSSRVQQRADGSAVRIAVDGVDGAGKTVFANELAEVLRAAGRTAVRASVDDFHRPRAERYRRGRNSPSGFWLDSFDYPRLLSDLLDPLAPGGSRRYRPAAHDVATDQYVNEPWPVAQAGTVLVLHGLFLHRDELHELWNLSVFLDVSFSVTAARMAARDRTPADPEHPSMRRYVAAQRRYFRRCAPMLRANIVVDNNDWSVPIVRRCC